MRICHGYFVSGLAGMYLVCMGPRVGVVVMCPWLTEEQREAVRKMAEAQKFDEDRAAERRYAVICLVLAVVFAGLTWLAVRT